MKKILTLSILAASSLLAATPNVDAIQNSISTPKAVEDKKEENKKDLIEVAGQKSYAPMMIDDKSGKKILVKDFVFEGNDHIKSADLQNLIKEFGVEEYGQPLFIPNAN